jgi:hypothetical protein
MTTHHKLHLQIRPHEHRPARRHPRSAAHWQWALPVVGGVMGVVVGGLLLLTLMGVWQARRNATPPVARYMQVFGPKAQVVTDLYQMSLTGEVTTVATDAAFTPAPGDDIIIVPMIITNAGAQTRNFIPSTQIYLRDDEGMTYTMHPTLALTKPIPAAELKHGESAQGQVSFEVPKRISNFRLYIDSNWAGMAPVVFKISR